MVDSDDKESQWQAGPLPPPSPIDEVHVWRIWLGCTSETLYKLAPLLNGTEWRRCRGYLFESDGLRFLMRRSALRLLLGAYCSIPAARIRFQTDRHGKPYVSSPDISFNVSSSGSWSVLAFARGARLGIDIECEREMLELPMLARCFTEMEAESILSLRDSQERIAAFFRCWVGKEAYVKAEGHGLSIPLNSFEVDIDRQREKSHSAVASKWLIRPLPDIAGFRGAVAVERMKSDSTALRFFEASLNDLESICGDPLSSQRLSGASR